MPDVQILREEECYRLIGNGEGGFAVVEARHGRIYSVEPGGRAEAEDTPEGMATVVGEGWSDEPAALELFQRMIRRERRYAETIW